MITLPRQAEQITDNNKCVSRSWSQFFNSILETLGFIKSRPVYQKIWIDAMTLRPSTLPSVVLGTYDASCYINGSNKLQYFCFSLPKNLKQSTDINIDLYWSPFLTATGSVTWKLDYILAGVGSNVSGAGSTEIIIDSGPMVEKIMRKSSFTAISGIDSDNVVLCVLTRLGSDNTYTAFACLSGIMITYQVEGVGA
jgi:hypothetical protein